jgi:drug/metabolite transporter (DMT)-like permease
MNEGRRIEPAAPRRATLLLAFGAVYLIWGSTYLAIRIGLESLPPFFLMGMRSLAAGSLLYAWGRLREGAHPSPIHWRTSLLIGGLFFLGGHGGLAWAETRVPSGAAALVIAGMPIWMVLLGGREGGHPLRLASAILLGICGVATLAGPASILGSGGIDPGAAIVLVLASLSWAIASVLSRRVARPASNALATGMDLLSGGALLCAGSILRGEPASLGRGSVSLASVAALLYLVLFGSVVALTAYNWLLRNTTLSRASSYVYVNPVVAVIIGWALGGEALTARVAAAAALLIFSVVLIMTGPVRPAMETPRDDLEPATCGT